MELPPGGILEIVGPNASGKTSLAVCAQAVLAMEGDPLHLGVAGKRHYPHNEQDGARVYFMDADNNEVTWWPNSGKIQAPPNISTSRPEAVGLVDFTAKRSAKERAALFQGALLPPPEDVMAEVEKHLTRYLPPTDLTGVMDNLRTRGWDSTLGIYMDRAKVGKREWRTLTGRNYGVRIATDWRPDGWLADFDNMTAQSAESGVTNARDALDALHRVQAVSEAQAQAAQDAAESIPDLEAQQDELETEHRRLRDELAKMPLSAAQQIVRDHEGVLRTLRAGQKSAAETQHCPFCEKALTVDMFGAIRKGGAVDPSFDAEIEATESVLQTARDKVNRLIDDAAPYQEKMGDAERKLDIVRDGLKLVRRDARMGGTVVGPERQADLAKAEQDVEDAKVVVDLIKAEAGAARLHETITRYTEIAKALGPEGVRAKMLGDGLRKLNAGLGVIASTAGWPLVDVAENGGITVDDRPVLLCSESERWRCQFAIQATLGVSNRV